MVALRMTNNDTLASRDEILWGLEGGEFDALIRRGEGMKTDESKRLRE